MIAIMVRRISRWAAIVAVVVIGLACAGPDSDTRAESPAATADQAPLIDHLSPRRDSVGGVPTYFEWTKIEKADRYHISLWNDVDLMVWRQNVHETRVEWPKGEPLEPGTYFWAVSAFSGDRPIAESGRAAFVVRTAQ